MERHPLSIERANVPELNAILGIPHKVLDTGFIRVIDYMGNDAAVVQAARVSYGEGTKTIRTDAGLIDYLLRNWHTSPFEHCVIKIHVKLPLFVARQWIRHRTASVNEISARYSVLEEDFYTPDAFRAQAKKNKQGSEGRLVLSVEPICEHAQESYRLYRDLLDKGVAREMARMVLPANVYTQWYWTCDLHNVLHSFMIRRKESDAQWEIRQYAEVLADIVKVWCPVTWASFEKHRLGVEEDK